jgi:hypothetical protein
VLTLQSLSTAELRHRLRAGLSLPVGPFRYRVQTDLPRVAENLAAMYADFPLGDDAGGFHDFHVRVGPAGGLRRWVRPQVNFWLDGHRPFKPLPADQAYALLEWGMNWCVAAQAHHYLLLHAAVLERHDRCVILPGDPGSGKSTLTAALMLSGWRLLSDELTVIDRNDGRIEPLARPVSLKNESIDVIRAFDAGAIFGQTARDTHKGTVSHLKPSVESVARVTSRGQPAHIVFPRWQRGAETSLRRRPKADAFMHLANHGFNYSLLGRLGFELCAGLVQCCECWDFSYSRLEDALRRFEEFVP